MGFKQGDRVRWGDDKTGTVLSEPREYNLARGDSFTGVAVEVLPDESVYGTGATLLYVATLTRLDGPETVVLVDLDDEKVLEEIVRADPHRGVESIDSAASRLQKQIIRVVRRASELDPDFRILGSRVNVGQAAEVLEAHRELTGIPQERLEKLRSMEVNLLVVDPEDPE